MSDNEDTPRALIVVNGDKITFIIRFEQIPAEQRIQEIQNAIHEHCTSAGLQLDSVRRQPAEPLEQILRQLADL